MIDEYILYLTPFGSDLLIRFLKEKCDLSIKDFALKCGIEYSNLNRILKDKNAFLDGKLTEKIVKTFGYEDYSCTVFESFYNITEDIKEWMNEEGEFFTVDERIKFRKEDSIVFLYYINHKFGITLECFSKKININHSSLKKNFYGETRFFDKNNMKKICDFLGFKYKKISVFDNFRVMMLEIYKYYAINKLK